MRVSNAIPPARDPRSRLNALASIPVWPELGVKAQESLKVLALISMIADHANRVLTPYPHAFPGVLLEWFGRLAFPLFCLLIAYNLAVRRVDWRRYLVPLLAAGLIAQVPFSLVINSHAWNVMFTLLLGVLAVAVNDWLDRTVFKGAGAFGVLLVCLLNLWCDYPLFGCALIPLGVQLIRSRHALWWLPFLALCLLTNLFITPAWIALMLPVIVFGAARAFPSATEPQQLETDARDLEREHRTISRSSARRLPRWFAYTFYPAHLFALLALKSVLS